MEKGGISVNTENIFPVIKKWLYSDKDIFVREVVSNACDAVTKHSRLVSLGEASESAEPYLIKVKVDTDEGTLTVSDNGIGMTADEVRNYINQIALSGAMDFISKYETGENGGSSIIGHFGLGFYSVFMVADKAEIVTKSYKDEKAVHWTCTENGEYTMEECDRATRGTDIIMHISEDEKEYLNETRIKDILEKYCAFMPYEIKLGEETVNDTNPIWQRNPSDVTDDEYKEFYKKVFDDYRDPLMWVHINADYPLNFKGVLFFPQKKSDFETPESKIKLFYNSVFVADNINEVCPDFLINLHGVLDCPELPLNVSRSYLQNDTYIRRVSQHIAKKVADKLNFMFNDDREGFEKIWDGIKPYIQYGCIKDEKFSARVLDSILFKVNAGGYTTLKEYVGDREECTVYYTTDVNEQNYYVNLFEEKGEKVLVFDTLLDSNFSSYLESKNEKIKFARVDSAVDKLGEQGDENVKETLTQIFKDAIGDDKLTYSFAAMSSESAPALISVNEESRRMADMMRMYMQSGGSENAFPVQESLLINTASPLISRLAAEQDKEKAAKIARHIWLSAKLLSGSISTKHLQEYVSLNNELLNNL